MLKIDTEFKRQIRNEYFKQYHEDHKEKKAEYGKQYYQEHKEEKNQYYQDHKATIAEYQKQYAKAHPEQFKQKNQVRMTQKKNLPATLTVEQWINIKQSFNNNCSYCGCTEKLEQEHFVPLSKGGEYTHNNIIPVCKSCNCSKNVSNFFVWYPKQSFYSKKREKAIFEFLNYKNGIQQLALV